jgi:hypothetical protein
VTSDDPVFDGMQGNVGRVAARYLPHHDCEAYVAGPVAMVRKTIRALTRAGIPPERIHYDDALLAEDKEADARKVSGATAPASQAAEAGPPDETAQLDQADPQDAAAETAQPDGDLPGPGRPSQVAASLIFSARRLAATPK